MLARTNACRDGTLSSGNVGPATVCAWALEEAVPDSYLKK